VTHLDSKRQTPPATGRRPISWGDLVLMAAIPWYAALSWLLPESCWRRVCRAIDGLARPFKPANPLRRRVADHAPPALTGIGPNAIVDELEAGRREHYLQVFRCYRPGGWRPSISLEGMDKLEAAAGNGKGAILWIDHFVFNGLAPKLALQSAGFPFTHLSRPEHGFSKTSFGVRFLNPLRSRAEAPFLDGRVVIQRGAEGRALKRLMSLLKQGRLVSITAGAWEGRKRMAAPVFGRRLPLATGAPALAISTGAPLLPVTVVRDPHTAVIRVVVGEPFDIPEVASKESALRQIVDAYGGHIEPWIAAFPGQWRGWGYLQTEEAAAVAPSEANMVGNAARAAS